MARTGGEGPKGISAFAVETGLARVRVRQARGEDGLERLARCASCIFEGCDVPAGNLVGEEGQGFTIALAALDGGRLGIAACSVGLAQAALDAAVAFARERASSSGGRSSSSRACSSCWPTWPRRSRPPGACTARPPGLRDAGEDSSMAASMAKLFASDTAMRVTTDAVQIHGGYGYMQEYPVERYMREAKALQIVEGTNQVQRMVIGRQLAEGRA